MKHKNIWNQISRWTRAFLILSLAFLIIGLATLGSVRSIGKSYTLSSKRNQENLEPGVIVNVSDPEISLDGNSREINIKQIYVNVGAAYTEIGDSATLRIGRGTSAQSGFYNYSDVEVINFYVEEEAENSSDSESATVVTPGYDLFNWVLVDYSPEGFSLSTYSYWKFMAIDHDILLNEVVFVGTDNDGNSVILSTKIDSESVIPDSIEKAEAIIDKQGIPSLSQSSYFRFGQEEVYSLMTISEMRQGSNFATGNIYHMDAVYNSFGIDLLALGTAIFGVSPFGLRIMPFLASFGILVFGFLFVRRLLKSDRAGFAFALLYALCGSSISLGHFGTPLMLGLFFFIASLYFCFRFFSDGILLKKKGFFHSLAAAGPVIFGGLFAACAICVNGAFLIPVIGLVALFIAGVIRQDRSDRAALEAAIDEAEEEEKNMPKPTETEQPVISEGRKKVAAVLNDSKAKRSISIGLFCAFFIMGFFLITVLASLPLYTTFTKVLDNPADPSKSIFSFMLNAFLGGFIGSNPVYLPQSAWKFFYILFQGSGEVYAVTACGILISIAAIVIGIIGAVCALVRLSKKKDQSAFNEELVRILLPVFGFALALVSAAFAQGALAFIFLACLCLFFLGATLAQDCDAQSEGSSSKSAKYSKICLIAGVVLLSLCFLLFAVFTFSIPLSASFLASIL